MNKGKSTGSAAATVDKLMPKYGTYAVMQTPTSMQSTRIDSILSIYYSLK